MCIETGPRVIRSKFSSYPDSTNSTGYLRIFPLSYDPTPPDSIRVWVDGVELVGAEWSYDLQKHAVVFAAAFAPSSYSLITIEYQTACD